MLSTGTLGVLAGCAGDADTTTAGTTGATSNTKATTATEATTGFEPSETDGTETTESNAVTEAERVAIAKQVTADLAAGEYEAVHERFTESFKDEITTDQIAEGWEAYTKPKGAYRGATVAEQGTSNGYPYVVLRATFESGTLLVSVFFDDEGLAGLKLQPAEGSYDAPPYAESSAFSETTVSVPSPACDLGGTLTMPTTASADAPVPGVVLVHGTGPNDRNTSVGPNRPFQDLAWGLATRGIAVLRYDKRTFACDVSREDGLDFGAVTVDDAVTAIERLREEEAVGPIAVVGHSQGGLAAPRIAKRADTDGMGALAGPSGSLAGLIPYQLRYLAELDGAVYESERENIEAAEASLERIQSGDLGDDEMELNFHANFWRDLADYDQTAVAAALDVPQFHAFGGRDWQVPVDRARPEWERALADAESVTFRTYDDANHLFIPGEGTPTAAEYYQPGHVTESLVEDLGGWVLDLGR